MVIACAVYSLREPHDLNPDQALPWARSVQAEIAAPVLVTLDRDAFRAVIWAPPLAPPDSSAQPAASPHRPGRATLADSADARPTQDPSAQSTARAAARFSLIAVLRSLSPGSVPRAAIYDRDDDAIRLVSPGSALADLVVTGVTESAVTLSARDPSRVSPGIEGAATRDATSLTRRPFLVLSLEDQPKPPEAASGAPRSAPRSAPASSKEGGS